VVTSNPAPERIVSVAPSRGLPQPHYPPSLFFYFILSGVRLSPLGTAATIALLYQPHMVDDGGCGATVGMKIGRGNRSTRRKPVPMPLCPPQIRHDLNQAAVGSQQLTALAKARPTIHYSFISKCSDNLPAGKWRPELKADNITAICKPIIYKMWEPRRLTTL
jgi:hypothetical protein